MCGNNALALTLIGGFIASGAVRSEVRQCTKVYLLITRIGHDDAQ